jgi:hypothetical protein
VNTFNKVEAVKSLRNYINTYDQQAGYDKYTDKTFILDILYGLGVAADKDKHFAAQGFDVFLGELLNLIAKEKPELYMRQVTKSMMIEYT